MDVKKKEKQRADSLEYVKSLPLEKRIGFIHHIDDIPALPMVVTNVLEKLNDPKMTFKQLEEIISLDPALVAYILRIINSPIYALKVEVMTVIKAISILGESNLRSLIIGYGVRTIYKKFKDSYIQNTLWKHSVTVGVLSKVISEEVYGVVHSQAYVFGLLHDIGKIVLLMHNPRKFKESQFLVNHGSTQSADAEYDSFGFSHIETGFFMLNKFGFSKDIKHIIQFHHDPEFAPGGDPLVWVVSLANKLSYMIADPSIQIDVNAHLKQLDLTEAVLEKIKEEGKTQIDTFLSKFL